MTNLQEHNSEFWNDISKLFDKYGGIRGSLHKEFVRFLRGQGLTCFHTKFSSKYISTLGLQIETLIDVGVDEGTPELYAAFPKAKVVLVDPLFEALEKTRSKFPSISFFPFPVAAGARDGGGVTIAIPRSGRGRSSQMGWLDSAKEIVETRDVPVRRIDRLVESVARSVQPPFGIKVDVEGAELGVIRGCEGIMQETSFILVEANVKGFYQNQAKISQITNILGGHGFELFDILNPSGRPPSFFDLLFLPQDSKLFHHSPPGNG